ncbi:hypothetical protein ACJX0J_011335 [Zea mays]
MTILFDNKRQANLMFTVLLTCIFSLFFVIADLTHYFLLSKNSMMSWTFIHTDLVGLDMWWLTDTVDLDGVDLIYVKSIFVFLPGMFTFGLTAYILVVHFFTASSLLIYYFHYLWLPFDHLMFTCYSVNFELPLTCFLLDGELIVILVRWGWHVRNIGGMIEDYSNAFINHHESKGA